MTAAQRQDPANYQQGDSVRLHQNVRGGFRKGEAVVVAFHLDGGARVPTPLPKRAGRPPPGELRSPLQGRVGQGLDQEVVAQGVGAARPEYLAYYDDACLLAGGEARNLDRYVQA